MRALVKTTLSGLIASFVAVSFRTSIGKYVCQQIVENVMTRTTRIRHQGLDLQFFVPNRVNGWRVDTFSTKEPETLNWIDGFSEGSVLWDIGANVGLYSCYAAKRRGCKVFAFEPSVFNLELLAKNIFVNHVTDLLTIVPLPLSDALGASMLNMSSTEWGGAESTFGQSYSHDGQPLSKVFEYQTIGLSMVEAVDQLKISQPDYIKIDVDGIEHLILKGGGEVLRTVKGVLVEINEEFLKQTEDAAMYLKEAGLEMKDKRHAGMFDNTYLTNCYNQIWQRPSAEQRPG